jgi:hypothetical protein
MHWYLIVTDSTGSFVMPCGDSMECWDMLQAAMKRYPNADLTIHATTRLPESLDDLRIDGKKPLFPGT